MPIGETLLRRDIDFFINVDEHAEISAVSWEATIQKHIEEELYDPALEVMIFSLSIQHNMKLNFGSANMLQPFLSNHIIYINVFISEYLMCPCTLLKH